MLKRLLMIAAMMFMAIPAKANDDLKKQLYQLVADYAACYTKQEAACIVALYTSDGFMVNPAGIAKPADVYGNAFKMGFNKLDAVILQAHPIGPDAMIATGTYHITGKDKDGKALDASGRWSATYIKEGGKLKVRMLTAAPAPPKAS